MRFGGLSRASGVGAGLGVALAVLAAPCVGQVWPVDSAVGRVHLERARKTAWPATVGWVRVWAAGLDPLRCRVAVFTGGGRAVGSQIIWAANGEPLTVLFDTSSGEVSYDAYLHEGAAEGPAWQPEAGVILETRLRKEGPVDTWDKTWRLYQGAEPVLGRSVVTNIFLGLHPHGPTANFMGHYRAWFPVKTGGEYQFAVAAIGSTFLRVDGKVVVHRPGVGGSRGRRGEYNGKISLAPGRHKMEVLFTHAGGGDWLMEVGWKDPGGKDYFVLMPAEAFTPLARFETFSWTPSPNRTTRGAIEWEMAEHNLIEGLALVSVQLRSVGGRKDTVERWQFDDGATATGSPVTHVFPRTGIHQVQFTADATAAGSATLTERINVRPNWWQVEEWRDPLFERQKKQLLTADLSAMPPEDLGALVKFADAVSDRALLSRLGSICLKRQADFKSYQAETFYTLGWHYAASDVRDYPGAEQCWRGSLALAADDSGVKEKSRLQLAHLLTDAFNKPGEALPLLKSIRAENLVGDYLRQGRLFEGDALAAQGKLDEALKVYRAAGSLVAQTNVYLSVRGAARLESARDLIRREEYDAAEGILRQIEWETPQERLSTEVGLPMILIHLGRKEYPLALTRCQRLMYSATLDTHRAEVLYCLIEAELALGREDAAQQTLDKLIKDHPYSEATARARDRWGKRIGPARKS
jgi:tetratricopeptide (TPR) repeat protein